MYKSSLKIAIFRDDLYNNIKYKCFLGKLEADTQRRGKYEKNSFTCTHLYFQFITFCS